MPRFSILLSDSPNIIAVLLNTVEATTKAKKQ